MTIVLLDNLNTLYGSAAGNYESTPYWMEDLALANAKTHLIEFIRKLGPQDRVAIYGLRDSLQVLCDFTSDRGQLLAILKKYDTTSKTNRETVEPGEIHTPMGPEVDALMDAEAVRLAGLANQERAQKTMTALDVDRRPRRQHSRPQEPCLAHGQSPFFGRRYGSRIEPCADCGLPDRRPRAAGPRNFSIEAGWN